MNQQEVTKLEIIHNEIVDIKEDVSYMKSRLLNPDDGALARANRNTSFRKEVEPLIKEVPDLIQFKKTVYRIIWMLATAIVALGAKMLLDHPM